MLRPRTHIPFTDLRMKVVDTQTEWPQQAIPPCVVVQLQWRKRARGDQQGQEVRLAGQRQNPAVSTLVVAMNYLRSPQSREMLAGGWKGPS